MRQLPALFLLLLLGAACSRPVAADPYANRRSAPLQSGSNTSGSSGTGLGSERDAVTQQDFGTFRVKEETWLAIGLHDTRTLCRDRSFEEEKEFERLVEKGRIRKLSVGTLVRMKNSRTQVIDGRTFEMYRVELVDDPDIHGNVFVSALEPVK